MTSLFSEHHPRITLNIYLVTLLPIIVSYLPFIILTILHLVVHTPLVQTIVRTIKISQFAARIGPWLFKADPATLLCPHRIVFNLLHAAYSFWSSRSWLELLCLAVKEILKWNGVPQELFDTLNDLAGSSWFTNLLFPLSSSSSLAPASTATAATIASKAYIWTPTLDKPFPTDGVMGFSPAVGGLNISD